MAGVNPSSLQVGGAPWSRTVQNRSPDTVTPAASTQAERGPVCVVAHPAGYRGGTYPHPVTNSLLFSEAQVPRGARFPSLPCPLAWGVSSWRVFPDQLLLLGSGSVFPAPLPGSGAGHLPNLYLESAWSLILGVTDIMIHIGF